MRVLSASRSPAASCVVMVDPYHEYAEAFARSAREEHDLGTFCVYTSEKAHFYRSRSGPVLPREAIIGEIQLDDVSELGAVGPLLRSITHPRAVLPLTEDTMGRSIDLASHLGLLWSPEPVLRRFRDKYAMKAHVRRTAPHVRIGHSRLVATADDVFRDSLPSRFVIKPNAGHGNRDVRIFGATDRNAVDRYCRDHAGELLVLEEYIGGVEYFVNGQTDAAGAVQVLAIFEYNRVTENGLETIIAQTRKVHRRESVFVRLEEYAVQVIRSTGLQRSPFHMDVKVDDVGPSMIEVGARLAGKGNAFDCSSLHAGAANLFDVATAHLVRPITFVDEWVDWTNYESRDLLYVHGISSTSGHLWQIDGVADVEAMPEFHRWLVKPARGDALVVTQDLHSIPYLVALMTVEGAEGLPDAATRVRTLIRLNESSRSVWRVAVWMHGLASHIMRRLHWSLASTLRRVLPQPVRELP